MRTIHHLLLLSAGVVLAGTAWADPPHPINYDWHDPIDLKAYTPPGPQPGADGTGNNLVEPPRPADAARLYDPKEVKWPTLDRSEWEKSKGQYNIVHPNHPVK
jgi:hypothetical protein